MATTQTLHPGVYVNEVPQTAQPITGASTSTAGFVGWVPETIYAPVFDKRIGKNAEFGVTLSPPRGGPSVWVNFPLSEFPAACNQPYSIAGILSSLSFQIGSKSFGPFGPKNVIAESADFPLQLGEPISVDGFTLTLELVSSLENRIDKEQAFVMLGLGVKVTEASAPAEKTAKTRTRKSTRSIAKTDAELPPWAQTLIQWIDEHPDLKKALERLLKLAIKAAERVLEGIVKYVLEHITIEVVGSIDATYLADKAPADLPPPGEVVMFTNYDDYTRRFGPLGNPDAGLSVLSNAVYGFFDNGGRVCYVTRVYAPADVGDALQLFDPLDDVSMLLAPMPSELAVDPGESLRMRVNIRTWLMNNCELLGNRFAILDGEQTPSSLTPDGINPAANGNGAGPTSEFAGLYFPWLNVGSDLTPQPPSGHIAGVFARTDASRGVWKAPANEVVLGSQGLSQNISKNQQDLLNPDGINCIRKFSGSDIVWGARTLGGAANEPYKYVSSRRMMIYLEQSIRQSTKWVVFEPNSPVLWANIRRVVNDFLYNTWREGGLFGKSPQEAYFVKCDEGNNPPSVRALGQVQTLVGVALINPAEFVIFDIYQFTA